MDKRNDYLSWDEYFMAIAKISAQRSKDPNTQVGACIVSKDNRILSCGYNGAPNGFHDDEFPWKREGNPLNTKYMYVVHAELNAILNYRGFRKDFEDAILDGNHVARVLRANAGHLYLENSIVTNGHVENSYVSGVYITGKATFSMDGGKIINNTISTRYDYLEYATDLWIGSQASGEVATIDTDAEIGNVFVNANSYKTETGGKFVLDGGTISNVYVEYEDSYYGVFISCMYLRWSDIIL